MLASTMFCHVIPFACISTVAIVINPIPAAALPVVFRFFLLNSPFAPLITFMPAPMAAIIVNGSFFLLLTFLFQVRNDKVK